MIKPTHFTSCDFKNTFEALEEHFLDELEGLLVSKLMEQKSITLPNAENEVVEFAGRTNYKIRLKRPNKSVWSVSFQEFRESIRTVLRNGGLDPLQVNGEKPAKKRNMELPTLILLHILPDEEYKSRSFVGNQVEHQTMGEGEVLGITNKGNVEVKFDDRKVMLKPRFVKLKSA